MDEDEKAALTEAIRNALRMIIDPEIGRNIVDLGLIYEIAVEEGGIARIAMTTTTRGCPASDYLKDAVSNCVWYVPGVEYAEVRLTYEPPWTPEMIVAEG
ncbi:MULTISPECIES: metal-sulfur cluster assembly factor [unclassified Shinella]|uniref:metal-sulfur cluster assembly factor n=1 Tax=unclassified Shinella TaxID=2643062 RepID=UPI00225C4DD4|nr:MULTISPECIES: metal-sulfur cluster assembly factor [unclassified Shinella]MCO5140604.1 metal-sulfur cluster assembly factor [Shinella sp.]MDC7256706.1 metal-sulfur cluster assembly factor [Shinella sp. YE25]CAI0339585.1 Fe-S protein maturation auxiliary factor YitW [Rhizobiaceae bacterium]CAK7257981.1 Fe-S protein maturation auxiliary factor YitW [Shinella sp. WSC3-e]